MRGRLLVCATGALAVAAYALFRKRRKLVESGEAAARRRCFTLVLTGGPCGGKTSSLTYLRQALMDRGYKVFSAPEVPTIFLSNGGTYPGHDGGERLIKWETAIVQLQRQLEDSFLMVACSSGSEKNVVIMDRGLLDIPAYIPPPQWQQVLTANQLTEAQLAARYDLVVHLTTAADGAEAFYGTDTNAARYETPQEAREVDARIRHNWSRAHPNVLTLSNLSTDFEAKCKRCVEAVVRSVDAKFGAPHKHIDKLALVYVRDRKQLVARSKGKSACFTPGGKREEGESDVQALVRECREELSVELRLESIRPFGVFEAQAHGKPVGTTVRMTCYSAEFVDEAQLRPANEIEELRWISSSEGASLTVTGRMLLADLKARGLVD